MVHTNGYECQYSTITLLGCLSGDTLQGQPLVHLFPGRNVTADPAPPDRSREIVQYR